MRCELAGLEKCPIFESRDPANARGTAVDATNWFHEFGLPSGLSSCSRVIGNDVACKSRGRSSFEFEVAELILTDVSRVQALFDIFFCVIQASVVEVELRKRLKSCLNVSFIEIKFLVWRIARDSPLSETFPPRTAIFHRSYVQWNRNGKDDRRRYQTKLT